MPSLALDTASYLALVVERATILCNLDTQLTVVIPKVCVCVYSVVLFLPSIYYVMSASI